MKCSLRRQTHRHWIRVLTVAGRRHTQRWLISHIRASPWPRTPCCNACSPRRLLARGPEPVTATVYWPEDTLTCPTPGPLCSVIRCHGDVRSRRRAVTATPPNAGPLASAVRVNKTGYFPADLLVLDASTPSEVPLAPIGARVFSLSRGAPKTSSTPPRPPRCPSRQLEAVQLCCNSRTRAHATPSALPPAAGETTVSSAVRARVFSLSRGAGGVHILS